ncbi:MAG: sugar ABC transporter ATP-binding protein [Burkholderiales bacterium]
MAATAIPLLRTVRLCKHYPGVRALDNVGFDLNHGEVHVLFGENGAGKSTLISLLAGASEPSSGHIEFEGRAVELRSVREARALGISAVFQEFSLVPTLSVAENLLLGDEPKRFGLLRRAEIRARALELLRRLDFHIDVDRIVGSLSRAEQQMVEIAKSQRSRLAVLILDEPTASLTDQETNHLFAMVERLRATGVGIIYISHRMQEIRRIADRITVLRDGCHIATVSADRADDAALVELMTGRSIAQIYPTIASRPGENLLELHGVSTRGGVRDASIRVRRSEVLGLAGLVGHGKSELMRAAFGIEPVVLGRVLFKGEDVTRRKPGELLARGMFYMPPDRRNEGLMLGFSCARNITLSMLRRGLQGAGGLIQRGRERTLASSVAERVELAPLNLGRAVGLLSGGNQQKVLFGKGLAMHADLYIFDEPTVGVDVGTRSALYMLIKQLTEANAAVVIISSDLPEILHLAHRAYVLRNGRVVGELNRPELTESAVLGLFFDGPAEPVREAA